MYPAVCTPSHYIDETLVVQPYLHMSPAMRTPSHYIDEPLVGDYPHTEPLVLNQPINSSLRSSLVIKMYL